MPTLTKAGVVHFDRDTDASLLPEHLASCLRGIYANSVEVRDTRVTFTGGLFRFVTNWNVLIPFGEGDLTVDSDTGEVRYRVSFFEYVAVTTIVCIIAELSW
jgi:hypothetical protein